MPIEEVIQILDPETRREALRKILVMERIAVDQEACRMAVAALRAWQAPAKLDRSRWEGCDICIVFEDGKPIESMHGDIVVKHPGNSSIEFIRHGECYDYRAGSVLGDFEFCPFCGRPLTEEAWAELERRIGGNDGTTD